MEFPYSENKNLLDIAELLADLRKGGFQGRIDERLREDLGGGSHEKINPLKKAANGIHEEAVSYRIVLPDFLIDIITAYLGRFEERGWRRAQVALEDKEAIISTLEGEVTCLEEENRRLKSENSGLKEDLRSAQVESERITVRADEREKVAEARILESVTAQKDLRKAFEQENIRATALNQALQDTTRKLEDAKNAIKQHNDQSQEMTQELAARREELTILRVQREADQSRLNEYKTEIAAINMRDEARAEEVRRLYEKLNVVERREAEASQRATSLQIEVERLRAPVDSPKARRQATPKANQ